MPLHTQTASRNQETSRYVKATEADSVPLGDSVAVKLEGYFIGIHNVDGEYYAIDNVCPHVAVFARGQTGGWRYCLSNPRVEV